MQPLFSEVWQISLALNPKPCINAQERQGLVRYGSEVEGVLQRTGPGAWSAALEQEVLAPAGRLKVHYDIHL